jgi:hypothetical protein
MHDGYGRPQLVRGSGSSRRGEVPSEGVSPYESPFMERLDLQVWTRIGTVNLVGQTSGLPIMASSGCPSAAGPEAPFTGRPGGPGCLPHTSRRIMEKSMSAICSMIRAGRKRAGTTALFAGVWLLLVVPVASAQAPLPCGVAQTNTIAAIGERDAYSYAATAGEVVSIRMTALGAGLDAQLELRDGASNLLASAASRIDRVLTNAETYLIIALDQGNNETGDYALVLQRVVNPCNSAAVSCGATAQASLDGAGEVNAWTFTAAAGDVMTFRLNVTNSASQFSPRLEIFDPLGRTVLASGSSFRAF